VLPEPLEFYLDETNDCPHLAQALIDAGQIVHRRKEHFKEGTDDIDWIPVVAENRWIIITRDTAQRKIESELRALIVSKARSFCIPNNAPRAKMAELVLKALPEISKLVARHEGPLIASIHENTKGGVNIAVYYPTKQARNKYAQFSKADKE